MLQRSLITAFLGSALRKSDTILPRGARGAQRLARDIAAVSRQSEKRVKVRPGAVNDVVNSVRGLSLNEYLQAASSASDDIDGEAYPIDEWQERRERKREQRKKIVRFKRAENKHPERPKTSIRYVSLDTAHDRTFQKAVADARRKNEGKAGRAILLEGAKLISDALNSSTCSVKTIFFSKHCDDLPEREIAEQAVPVYHISENAMKTWSIMTTPPGVIAIASPIDYSKLERATPCMPVSVIADSVSDPGNMGSLIRTCAAVGCDALYTTKTSVNAFDEKVLRAAMGAHFYLPVHLSEALDVAPIINSYFDVSLGLDKNASLGGLRVYVADTATRHANKEKDKAVYSSNNFFPLEVDEQTHLILVVGSENGLPASSAALLQHKFAKPLYVPMAGGVDSLNLATAAGIILFEIRRQFTASTDLTAT